jgi:hypothetical protein
MGAGFLAMQLAVASHEGDEQLHPLVRRLWSATRGAREIPVEVLREIEGCAHDLLTMVREPADDPAEQLRAATERVEEVFVTLALLSPDMRSTDSA